MLPTILIIIAVVVMVVVWLACPTGRRAVRQAFNAPVLTLPALGIWAFVLLISNVDLGALNEVFFQGSIMTVTIGLSVSLLAQMAAHILATTLLLYLMSRRLPELTPAPFARLLVSVAILLVVVWIWMFFVIGLMGVIGVTSMGMMLGVILPVMAVAYFTVNMILAPLAATLVKNAGSLGPALSDALRVLKMRKAPRLWPTVTVRLLMAGFVTVVILYAYTTTQSEGSTRHTDTRTAWNFSVNTHCVLNITVDNSWPGKVYAELREKSNPTVVHAVGLITALLATLFMVAIAQISARALTSSQPVP